MHKASAYRYEIARNEEKRGYVFLSNNKKFWMTYCRSGRLTRTKGTSHWHGLRLTRRGHVYGLLLWILLRFRVCYEEHTEFAWWKHEDISLPLKIANLYSTYGQSNYLFPVPLSNTAFVLSGKISLNYSSDLLWDITSKWLYRYIGLLYWDQLRLLHVSATSRGNLQGGVLWSNITESYK